jgi:hypothetical protein
MILPACLGESQLITNLASRDSLGDTNVSLDAEVSGLDALPHFSRDGLCASCLALSADLLLKSVRNLRFVVFVVVSTSTFRPAQVVALKITAAGDVAVPIIWAANAWAAWVTV